MSQNLPPEIVERIHLLEKKFKNSGQDLSAYLDGLLHDEYITYWEYIHLDTLLSLQVTRTNFPDEQIFISYHQITELYFKLVLHEIKQLIESKNPDDFFLEKIKRINRYFEILIDSFDVMESGMEKEQFMKFRLSLIPASGFQSVQFRMIEIHCTPLYNLVDKNHRNNFNKSSPLEEVYEYLYWKFGATDSVTGEKTLTLRQFEKRYTPRLLRIANQYKNGTLYNVFQNLKKNIRESSDLIDEMRKLDQNINVNWGLAHYKTAFKYLSKKDNALKATGGTNWEQFLPPNFQNLSFFPNLWTKEERQNWGKSWVEELVSDKS